MSNKPTHDILLAENYQADDGEEKAYFTNIGSAWQKDSGPLINSMQGSVLIQNSHFICESTREHEEMLQPSRNVRLCAK